MKSAIWEIAIGQCLRVNKTDNNNATWYDPFQVGWCCAHQGISERYHTAVVLLLAYPSGKQRRYSACMRRTYGHVTAVDTEQDTFEVCFADGTDNRCYKLAELASLQQRQELQWILLADIILSSLDSIIK